MEGKKGGNIQRIMTQQHVDDEEFKATTLLLWALSSTRCVQHIIGSKLVSSG